MKDKNSLKPGVFASVLLLPPRAGMHEPYKLYNCEIVSITKSFATVKEPNQQTHLFFARNKKWLSSCNRMQLVVGK